MARYRGDEKSSPPSSSSSSSLGCISTTNFAFHPSRSMAASAVSSLPREGGPDSDMWPGEKTENSLVKIPPVSVRDRRAGSQSLREPNEIGISIGQDKNCGTIARRSDVRSLNRSIVRASAGDNIDVIVRMGSHDGLSANFTETRMNYR